MTCVDIQNKLSAYTDGELSRWTRWKVQQHLGHCPHCAGVLRELESVDDALLGCLGAEPAPVYLTGAVMLRLPAMPPPWRRPAVVARWAAAGALAGVQLMAVYGAYQWGLARGASPTTPDSSRGGVAAPLGGASLRPVSPERRWTGIELNRSEAPYRPVSLWGRRELEEPFAPVGVTSPTSRRVPLTPVFQPGGAH